MLRNFMEIVGITPEEELPQKFYGQLLQIADTETIYLDALEDIRNIYQVIIDTQLLSSRAIHAPTGQILVQDGVKKIKILYYDSCGQLGILNVERGCNFILDMEEKPYRIEGVRVYLADAYFQLYGKKELYVNLLYMLCLPFDGERIKVEPNIEEKQAWHLPSQKSDLVAQDLLPWAHRILWGKQDFDLDAESI